MKILIDLDVVTNALWKGDSKQEAKKFLEKVKRKEFELYTPFILLRLVEEWKDKKLAKDIVNFYTLYSVEILSADKIETKFTELNINRTKLQSSFSKIDIKEEDSFLVLIASAFELDIKTFNRKHLIDKKNVLNEILKSNGLKEVEISEP